MDEQAPQPLPPANGVNLPPVVLDTDAEKRMNLMLIAAGFLVILIGIAGIYLLAADPTTSSEKNTLKDNAPVPTPNTLVAPQSGTNFPLAALPLPMVPAKVIGIPLTKETLAFDFNGDAVLNISDVVSIAQFADQHQYAAIYDIDSNGIVDKNDVNEVRLALSEHPEIEFDLTGDHKLDISDVVVVSQFVDQHQYANIYDFNADGAVDIKDVAIIRTAVSQAGSASEDPNLQKS